MPKRLAPKLKGGTLYAHVFENAHVGLKRNLFWNFRFDFEPLSVNGETWEPSAGVEWLTPTCRDWRELVGQTFDAARAPDAEASFYVWEHEPVDAFTLGVEACKGDTFEVHLTLRLSSPELGEVEADGRTRVTFEGIRVIPDNLSPKPSLKDVPQVVAPFLDVGTLGAPRKVAHAYLLPPRS